jgi:tryptophan-rich sensory protein
LLSLAASGVAGLASFRSGKAERRLYNHTLKQAPWAPPPWVFGPAWTVNNFFLLKGLDKLLASDDLEDRKTLLRLQAGMWAIFFSFGYIYFNRKSPLLAALWTVSDAVLAVTSFTRTFKKDKELSFTYLPLISWTTFASTFAAWQALKNPDPLLKTKALIS